MDRLTVGVAELVPPVQVGRRHLMAVVVLQGEEPRVVEAHASPGASAAIGQSAPGRTSRRCRRIVTNGTVVPAAAPLVTTRSTPRRSPAGTSDRIVRVGRRRRRRSPRTGSERPGRTTTDRRPRSRRRSRSRRRRSGRRSGRRRHRPERPTVERGVLPPTARREPERRHLGQDGPLLLVEPGVRVAAAAGFECVDDRGQRCRAAPATRASPHPGSSESNWACPGTMGHRRPRRPTCSPGRRSSGTRHHSRRRGGRGSARRRRRCHPTTRWRTSPTPRSRGSRRSPERGDATGVVRRHRVGTVRDREHDRVRGGVLLRQRRVRVLEEPSR